MKHLPFWSKTQHMAFLLYPVYMYLYSAETNRIWEEIVTGTGQYVNVTGTGQDNFENTPCKRFYLSILTPWRFSLLMILMWWCFWDMADTHWLTHILCQTKHAACFLLSLLCVHLCAAAPPRGLLLVSALYCLAKASSCSPLIRAKNTRTAACVRFLNKPV